MTSGHMVLSGEPQKKSPVTPPGIDPGTARLVAQCLNHYATPSPCQVYSTSVNTLVLFTHNLNIKLHYTEAVKVTF